MGKRTERRPPKAVSHLGLNKPKGVPGHLNRCRVASVHAASNPSPPPFGNGRTPRKAKIQSEKSAGSLCGAVYAPCRTRTPNKTRLGTVPYSWTRQKSPQPPPPTLALSPALQTMALRHGWTSSEVEHPIFIETQDRAEYSHYGATEVVSPIQGRDHKCTGTQLPFGLSIIRVGLNRREPEVRSDELEDDAKFRAACQRLFLASGHQIKINAQREKKTQLAWVEPEWSGKYHTAATSTALTRDPTLDMKVMSALFNSSPGRSRRA